ncbi:Putative pili assembly chaperone [Erwinia tasmaniensis Et1/99]|uniref:Pili assembly chaperone n=2 Tax=Erwinia tasmaniensis TaxID=338565 RepID=B2VGM5_ERWT9|nr:Putative pili assembly chaperone [Erwinia tasmaniensis Et1/99]
MRYFLHWVSFIFLFNSLELQATIMPLQDRVLFNSTDSNRRLLIVNNDSHAPVLLQSWVDDGSAGDINKEKNYPFAVIPAVARMTPGKILNLKILPTEKMLDLPHDRESVFWINLYEIPGVKTSQQAKNANKIEVGLNTQLKIIYRPFKSSMDINSIGGAIKIRFTDNGHSLELSNPTPYYVTPVSVKVKLLAEEKSLKLGMDRMIAPFGNKRFGLPEVMNSQNLTVEYTLVDDTGKEAIFTKPLN